MLLKRAKSCTPLISFFFFKRYDGNAKSIANPNPVSTDDENKTSDNISDSKHNLPNNEINNYKMDQNISNGIKSPTKV